MAPGFTDQRADGSKGAAMRIEVLGAQGGEMPGCRATAFRIDGRLALDAGGLASALSLEEQCRLDDVLITHAHLDHIKDLAFISDLVVGKRERPLRVHAAPGVVAALRGHFFNNVIWPDFTAIPTRSAPVMQLKSIYPLREREVGGYIVRALPVTHSVEAMGFVIGGKGATAAFTGDTGPTELFWEEINALPALDALFVEASFPNALQRVADLSLHLTPQTLDQELKKVVRDDVPVYLYHLKPAFTETIEREIANLGRPNLRVLRDGDVIELRKGPSPVWGAGLPSQRRSRLEAPAETSYTTVLGR